MSDQNLDQLEVNKEEINFKKASSFYAEFVGKGDMVFDIGPHQGEYSEVFLKLGAKVLAVEPRPSQQVFLNELFKDNKRFMVYNAAVGSKLNVLPMPEDRITPVIAALPYADEQQLLTHYMTASMSKTIDIQVVTLDKMIEEFSLPMFCKINVEGFGSEVLRGLSYTIPCIAVDISTYNLERVAEIIRVLLGLNKYEFNWSRNGSYKLEEKNWLNAKALHSSIAEYRKAYIEGVLFARIIEKEDQFLN